MKTILNTIILFILIGISFADAQGFDMPEEGKSNVYFVRVSGFGGVYTFEYFDNDKYVGAFKGKGYFKYELTSGEHLLWVSTENKEFLTADLKEGESYIVIVNIIMGAWKPRIGLEPITVANTKLFERAKEIIMTKKPSITSKSKIDAMNIKLSDFISEKLRLYNNEWKNEKNFSHISMDMAIPSDDMN